MSARPTPQQIAGARAFVRRRIDDSSSMRPDNSPLTTHLRVLLAATEPPTDEEIAGPAARFSTGIIFDGTANEDALLVLRDNPPHYTELEFRLEVQAFAAGARHFLGSVKS
jgi:hypothetical protein